MQQSNAHLKPKSRGAKLTCAQRKRKRKRTRRRCPSNSHERHRTLTKDTELARLKEKLLVTSFAAANQQVKNSDLLTQLRRDMLPSTQVASMADNVLQDIKSASVIRERLKEWQDKITDFLDRSRKFTDDIREATIAGYFEATDFQDKARAFLKAPPNQEYVERIFNDATIDAQEQEAQPANLAYALWFEDATRDHFQASYLQEESQGIFSGEALEEQLLILAGVFDFEATQGSASQTSRARRRLPDLR